MVRNYKPKGKRCQWNQETLPQAIADVQTKTFTIRAASRAYGIPRATLQDVMKATQQNLGYVAGKIGRKPTLSLAFERELRDHAVKMNALYYGITKADLCRLAYELATRNKIQHTFNEDKKSAGNDWFSGFLRRNPDLTMRIPESTSMSRVIGFRRSEINHFFENLTQVMASGVDPGRIFNVDETGLSTVQKQRDPILSPKGRKQVGKVTSAERGITITAVCCISATGVFIPPMLIFPRKKFLQKLLRGAPPGTIGGCSPSGWINTELFITWLKHFIWSTGASLEKKTILLLDNHESHISLEGYELCRSNGVILVSFAPHTSHRCQPLDVTVYGPLKRAYYKRCADWLKSNLGKRITDEYVAELFGDAYGKIATVDKCISGFRAAGIWPLNSGVFSDEEFSAADHLLHGHSTESQTEEPSTSARGTTTPAEPVTSAGVDIDCTAVAALSCSDGGVSAESETPSQLDSTTPVEPVTSAQVDIPCTPIAVSSCSPTRVSVNDISPVPIPLQKEGKRKSKQKRSEVLTASPMKQMLQEKKAKQEKKKEKETKQTERMKELKKQDREDSRKRKRQLDATTTQAQVPVRKTSRPKQPPKKKKKSTAESGDWICSSCDVHYGDTNDPKRTEEWVYCSGAGCPGKYHLSCGENSGVFDDDDSFVCKNCIC